MDKKELLKQLMPMFLGELEEHARTLNRDLLALEKEPSEPERAELLKTIFRAAHSLKGAARSVSVHAIEKICHRLEDLLAAVRDDERPLTPQACSLLFECIDAIEDAGKRLRQGHALPGDTFNALIGKLGEVTTNVSSGSPTAVSQSQLASADQAKPPLAQASSAVGRQMVAPPTNNNPPPPIPPAGSPNSGQIAKPLPGKRPDSASEISNTVRIAEEKLDQLLAQTGELLIARQRVATRPANLDELHEYVVAWKSEWRTVEETLGSLLRANGDGQAASCDGRQASGLSPRVLSVLGKTGQRLRRLEKDLEQLSREMVADVRQLGHVCGAVEDEVHRIRMLPFSDCGIGLERAVRDLARSGGKEVTLVIEGSDIEVDRAVLEGLSDPLLHLVRNCVDHGMETPDERRLAGKPVPGRITVSAALRGSLVDVVVADDGRGLDLDKIRQRAQKSNLPEADDEQELMRRIFLPGFSTASIITDVSGRGVGLDVVKNHVESLHGTIEVSTVAGEGTRFTLTVPLTLTTIAAVLLKAGGQVFAVASGNVSGLVYFGAEQVASVQGREALRLGEAPLPVAALAEALGLPERESHRGGEKVLGVILAAGEQRMVFIVDEVLAEQEIVVKNLGPRVRRVRHVTGATLLPSGRIALVLNAGNLVRDALSSTPTPTTGRTFGTTVQARKKRLLTADDSVTTRSLLKSILEAAGYDVAVAVDGQDAWQRLQDGEVDLLVSDVEMPRMNGFELTEAVRGSGRLAELPIVLVTGRESEEDKIRGIEAGASAYLIKSAFDQRNLLETIAQLL